MADIIVPCADTPTKRVVSGFKMGVSVMGRFGLYPETEEKNPNDASHDEPDQEVST